MEEYIKQVAVIIQEYITQNPSMALGGFGILLFIAAIGDWDWIFEPPYITKNIIGNTYGRTAYRLQIGFLGLFLFFIAIILSFDTK